MINTTESNPAATALATVGTVLWCIQLIPQIYHNWKRKDCTGVPPHMMFLWVISGIPFAIFFLILNTNIILQLQPHLFTFFCGVGFVQSCYYPPVKMPIWKIVAISIGIILVDIGSEIGFVLWLRPLYAQGIKWPSMIFGILASVLLAIGLLPPYFELAKRQGEVVGINFVFLTLDSLGAYFSIASVCVGDMDILSIILYAVIAVLEMGIFLSHMIWLCRFKWFGNDKQQQQQKNREMSESSEEDGGQTVSYIDDSLEIGTEKQIKNRESTFEINSEIDNEFVYKTATKANVSAIFKYIP
ncbi:similar to Saccharomyces cerevisiae YDR090C Putative protein of unknown function [Maudiozyma barnettii]|uniref:Uncharacterized protein n=1 Tax=Maudiozyma barnettii TaxID=61262 RepID=A0A8H2VKH7_9SACH|nr:uncharacterized protein KABA2_13S01672 [Kazachstania barnettii]CAB4257041.1 similar to Saccharomyces cerevisiae YDR090C Putative protein of unknown function [Kazachstania barnettii]CAD1779412.1 similar to Saccharomyces cerevisiae YDR090C Putative protein of unknown function [Kazachstania barnettii]